MPGRWGEGADGRGQGRSVRSRQHPSDPAAAAVVAAPALLALLVLLAWWDGLFPPLAW
jgi:hypothetical protein